MKKELVQQQQSSFQQQKSSISKSQSHRVGRKMLLKLCGVLRQYERSGSFTETQLSTLKTQLFLAAHRSIIALQNELELNKVCNTGYDHRYQLVSKVAHGRTFGKIINKCPTCRPGQLLLELDEARYICQLPAQLFHLIPLPPNCGLAFDFSEISHISWIHTH